MCALKIHYLSSTFASVPAPSYLSCILKVSTLRCMHFEIMSTHLKVVGTPPVCPPQEKVQKRKWDDRRSETQQKGGNLHFRPQSLTSSVLPLQPLQGMGEFLDDLSSAICDRFLIWYIIKKIVQREKKMPKKEDSYGKL